MRLFIALDFSDAAKEEIYKEARKALSSFHYRHKMVEIQHLHITLRFFGEMDKNQADEILKSMEGFAFPSKEVIFDNRIGWFYRKNKGFPLFLKLIQGSQYVKTMYSTLMNQMKLEEEQNFYPHLTLARLKDAPPSKDDLGSPELENAIATSAERIVLFESELTKKGPVYKELKSIILS